jgi:hypothetical protein
MNNPQQQRIISYYGASAVGNTTPTPSVGFTITDNTNIPASNMIRQSIVPGLINQSIPDNLQVNTFIMSSYIDNTTFIFTPNIILSTDRFYHINANIIISTIETTYNTYDYNLRGTILFDNTSSKCSCNLGFYGKNDGGDTPSTYKSTINDDILENTTLKIIGLQSPPVNPALNIFINENDISYPQITLVIQSNIILNAAYAIANITITSGTFAAI